MNEKIELNTDSSTYVIQKKIKHGSSSTKKILEETLVNQMKKRSTSGTDDIRKGSEWVIRYGVTNASVKDILEDEYSLDHKRWLTETYPRENSKIFSYELDFSDTSEEHSPEPSKAPTPPEQPPPEKPPPVVPKEKPPPEKKKVVVIKEPETEESSPEEESEEEPPKEEPSTNCAEYCKKYLEERDPDWMAHEMNRPFRRNRRHQPHVCDSSHSCFNNTYNSYALHDHKFHDHLSSNGMCSDSENLHLCSSFSYVRPDPPCDQRMSWKSQHLDNFDDKRRMLTARTNDISALCERCLSDQKEDMNDRSCTFPQVLRPMESNLFMGQKKTLYFIKSSPHGFKVMEEEKRGKRKDFWRTSACTPFDEAIESPLFVSYMSHEEQANSQQQSSRSQEEPVTGQPFNYRPHVENLRGQKATFRQKEESVTGQPSFYRSKEDSARGQQATFRQKEESLTGEPSIYRSKEDSARGQQATFRQKEESVTGQPSNYWSKEDSARGQQATFRQKEESVTGQPSNYRSKEDSTRGQQATFRQKEEPSSGQPSNYRSKEDSARGQQATFRQKEEIDTGQTSTYRPQDVTVRGQQSLQRSQEESARNKQVTFRPQEKSSRGQQTSYWPIEEPDENIHPACRSHEQLVRIQAPSSCTSADHQDYSKLFGLSPKSLEGRSLFWRRTPFDTDSGLPGSETDPCKMDVSPSSYRPRT